MVRCMYASPTKGAYGGASPPSHSAASVEQQTSDSRLRGGGHLYRSVFLCVLLAVVVLGQPAASSLPAWSFQRVDRERKKDLSWGARPRPFAESHEDLGAPAAAGLDQNSHELRGSAAADKGEGGAHPLVVDPFSAAQVLSADNYKKHLLAQVHLHKGLSLSDDGAAFVRSAETETLLSADTKQASKKGSLKDRKQQQRLRFPTGGESLLELAKEVREKTDEAKKEEETQLLLPASFASRNVAPHWPLFADDSSDLEEEHEEDAKEQQQRLKGWALPPKERQAASLVEAASYAKKEGGDSQAEQQSNAGSEKKEQEGESEGTEAHEKPGSSNSENQESASEEAGSAEEQRGSGAATEGSAAEVSETEATKHVSNDKQHESESAGEKESAASEEAGGGGEGQRSDIGDKEETEGSTQEEAPKQHPEAKGGEVSAAEENSSAGEEEGSKKDEGSKEEAASTRETHATESAAEASEQEKPETTSASAHGEKKPHQKHEEPHTASESKGSSSKEEQPSEAESRTHAKSAAAAASVALPETKEEQKAAKQQQQKQQKAAETRHEKTEEEKSEEHRMHMKQLAERATKLANIQRMEQDALLKLHMLGEGGPRENARLPSSTSSMSVQDQQQHRQLEEATKTAQSLTAHLRVQHELKKKEMALKQKEIAHLNLLKHLQVVMQSAVSTVWTKLTGVQATLKRLVQQSTYVNKRFLRETDNRVLRPQELPQALMSEKERKREGALAKKQGVSPLDCPVECAPKACDNKPSFPTHCFRYDLVAGGGGFRTCAPFTDEATAACPESYTRCAMAAPVRGRQYELLASPANDPMPQALFIAGNNMHSCLRLMIVHKETECTPSDAQSVQAAIKDSQAASGMPPPRVLEHGVAFPGEYKLCMLQFWIPPEKLKGDVIVLGVDEIGSVRVQEVQAARRPATAVQAERAAEAAERESVALDTLQPLPTHKPGELEVEKETAASTEEVDAPNVVPKTINLHPSPPNP
ncbi:hypothetical protein Esti_004887 [Eimeria stiedai]